MIRSKDHYYRRNLWYCDHQTQSPSRVSRCSSLSFHLFSPHCQPQPQLPQIESEIFKTVISTWCNSISHWIQIHHNPQHLSLELFKDCCLPRVETWFETDWFAPSENQYIYQKTFAERSHPKKTFRSVQFSSLITFRSNFQAPSTRAPISVEISGNLIWPRLIKNVHHGKLSSSSCLFYPSPRHHGWWLEPAWVLNRGEGFHRIPS